MIIFDLETRASISITETNVYRYVEDPRFSVLMMAYGDDADPTLLTTDEVEIRDLVQTWWSAGEDFAAHNSAFDRISLSKLLGIRYLDPARFIDSAVWAVEAGYPRKLELLAKALKVSEKDPAGTALINWFCKPDPKTGEFRKAEDHPEKWEAFCSYCVQDVDTLRECLGVLPLPVPFERELFVVSERINDRGMPIDLDLAGAAVEAGKINTARSKARVIELLPEVENPGSRIQMKNGLESIGLEMPNMQAETVAEMLAGDLTDVQREVLEHRQELSLSSAAKFAAALRGFSEGDRIRGSFKFYGASTGRWSGSGAQPQNLPRAAITAPVSEVVDRALTDDIDYDEAEVICDAEHVQEAIDDLYRTGEATPWTLKALVRSMFAGPMTVVDYSSIEARVLAWLAGEKWALQAFADGQDIYTETAIRMGPQFGRQQGKAATLGLGYFGGTNALRNIGMSGTEEELLPLVVTWRRANPKIVAFWDRFWQAWISGGKVGKVTVRKYTGAREVVLPSGGSIWYRGVRHEKYWVEDKKTKEKVQKEGWRYARPSGGRVRLWAGLAVENLTQRVARDLLANALIELDREDMPVIGHVHDEVLVEGAHSVDAVAEVMCRKPDWARGLPLVADGFVAPVRYRK